MVFEVDVQVFNRNIKKLYDSWQKVDRNINSDNSNTSFSSLSNVDAIVIVCGQYEVVSYNKTSSLQEWLFSVDISDSIVILCEKEIICYASKKKINYLQPITKDSIHPVVLYVKQNSNEEEYFPKMVNHIKSSKNGRTIGTFIKDKFEGLFFTKWQQHLTESGLTEIVDISDDLSKLMRIKQNEEIYNIQIASDITCNIFNKFFKTKLLKLIELNKKIKHNELASQIEECIEKKLYYPDSSIKEEDVEMAFPVILQSGNNYSVKFSIDSDNKDLKFDLIILMLGVRYKYYCSCLVRTLMINPSSEHQAYYKLIQESFDVVLSHLKPNNKFSDVYKSFYNFFEKKNKQLLEHISKNVGFSTGIEFRDNLLLLDEKNSTIIKENMVFNVLVSLNNVTINNLPYTFSIGDTVKIGASEPIICTKLSKRQLGNVSVKVDESSEESEDSIRNNLVDSDTESSNDGVSLIRESRGGRYRQRNLPTRDTSEDAELKRKTHQQELAKKLHANAMKRYLNVDSSTKSTSNSENSSSNTKFSCYTSIREIPKDKDIVDMHIFVDKIHDCIVLPIMGLAVPFHISVIKNINTSLESDYMYLRINFVIPIAIKNWSLENATSSNAVAYSSIKEVIYRSLNIKEIGNLVPDSAHLVNIFRQVKELQKKFKTQQAEEKELQGIVKQDDLQLSTSKNMPRLRQLMVRPTIGNRRAVGTLEVHNNGFRYSSNKVEHIDILFSNIRYAFYQPCETEMVTLIHFRLKDPLLVGKKKFIDIQFYTEVGAAVADLDKPNYTSHDDPDEIETEQRELETKQKINTTFKHFCEAVETLTDGRVEFDTPFRDLGFDGVPSRVSIFLMPTTHCLVNLMEMPFFILSLNEIELVHFERVQANTKHFDMVFVFKDYFKKVVMISCVPMSSLDAVRDWLDSCDIKYSEGIQSLNWAKIMKTINEDPKEFFESGGWSFLDPESEQEDNSVHNNSETDEDDYNPESSEEDYDDSDSHSYDSGDSNDDSFRDSDAESEDEPSDALSWDELEEVARREDESRYRHRIDRPASKRNSDNVSSTYKRKKSKY